MTANRPVNIERASRYLAFLLRHKPEEAGITLDRHGWAPVKSILQALRVRGYSLNRDRLGELVAADEKGRYELSPDGQRIRAAQGHSVTIDLGLQPAVPPERLWHGTIAANVERIRQGGLLRGKRQHVHLSTDVATAAAVGARRGSPIVLPVLSGAMHRAGGEFFLSTNGVWLTVQVATEFIDFSGILWQPEGNMAR